MIASLGYFHSLKYIREVFTWDVLQRFTATFRIHNCTSIVESILQRILGGQAGSFVAANVRTQPGHRCSLLPILKIVSSPKAWNIFKILIKNILSDKFWINYHCSKAWIYFKSSSNLIFRYSFSFIVRLKEGIYRQ